jgi:hypothetical protein
MLNDLDVIYLNVVKYKGQKVQCIHRPITFAVYYLTSTP